MGPIVSQVTELRTAVGMHNIRASGIQRKAGGNLINTFKISLRRAGREEWAGMVCCLQLFFFYIGIWFKFLTY
jgi:hypothetical protein